MGSMMVFYQIQKPCHIDVPFHHTYISIFICTMHMHIHTDIYIFIYMYNYRKLYTSIYILYHTQEQSLPIFSGPMHVRRECALSDVLNPKKLRRLAEGKSAFKTGRTVLTINLMTAISQTTIEKGQISPIAQWQHIKDLEIHPSHHSLKNTSHSH